MPFAVPASPCEHPAPDTSAYRVPPTNATSATPDTSPPERSVDWLDGRPSAMGVLAPFEPIFEIRAVMPPVFGPTGGGICGQSPTVVAMPPRPPSATYRQ